ncbi:MAG: phosphopantetheine-binding protein [Parvularculaceae bacterium]
MCSNTSSPMKRRSPWTYAAIQEIEEMGNHQDTATDQKIQEELLDILIKVKPDLKRDEIQNDTRLETLGVDSLDLVEIIFGVEEKYDISVPFNANAGSGDAEMFSTFGNVVEAVRDLISEQNHGVDGQLANSVS